MAPNQNASQLKRPRQSGGDDVDAKKPRRSARISATHEEGETESTAVKQSHLPSPLTRKASTSTVGEVNKARTVTPPNRSQHQNRTPTSGSPQRNGYSGLSSPPSDTQPFSQFVKPAPISYEVEDEEAEGVWGYLIPLKGAQNPLVLKKRAACPVPAKKLNKQDGRNRVPKSTYGKQEKDYEQEKVESGIPAGGYLLGRHPECDRRIDSPTVSNRHCLIFNENKMGDTIAVLEDLSGNGTYVNEQIIGRNKRRELHDGDEVSILDEGRFVFRYPSRRDTNGFRDQYSIQGQLGKGHFATVYLCTEKSTGMRYAVKKFEKRAGPSERSKVEGLQQEIAVLKGVSHPNMLCLRDTFDESDGVYLVLELAPEGELFNWIVMKHKLSEAETRKVFMQLFQGMKYLHERNIVHRDIKPENILLIDKELHIKVADFGLAKIIGEESFTTTLCGTPSYVAPEILESGNRRRYTRAVDVWSLGVVLYICLCGFPPFSDELYTAENPYTLSQQIKMGRFDYPSPYWDSVGDPALELIDRMLTVDVDKRITIDECLEHAWITQQPVGLTDSTDGLPEALSKMDFSKRKMARERTLLSSVNDIKVDHVINTQDGHAVKVFDKNPGHHPLPEPVAEKAAKELSPAHARDPQEFAAMGGKGDEALFTDQQGSRYPDETMNTADPTKPTQ